MLEPLQSVVASSLGEIGQSLPTVESVKELADWKLATHPRLDLDRSSVPFETELQDLFPTNLQVVAADFYDGVRG